MLSDYLCIFADENPQYRVRRAEEVVRMEPALEWSWFLGPVFTQQCALRTQVIICLFFWRDIFL